MIDRILVILLVIGCGVIVGAQLMAVNKAQQERELCRAAGGIYVDYRCEQVNP